MARIAKQRWVVPALVGVTFSLGQLSKFLLREQTQNMKSFILEKVKDQEDSFTIARAVHIMDVVLLRCTTLYDVANKQKRKDGLTD